GPTHRRWRLGHRGTRSAVETRPLGQRLPWCSYADVMPLRPALLQGMLPLPPRRCRMRSHQSRITSLTRRRVLQGTLGGVAGLTAWQQGWPRLRTAAAQPRASRGEMTWALQLNIVPTWCDPAETPGLMTPYIFLYALHDALVKPMPDHPMAPSLATAWHE